MSLEIKINEDIKTAMLAKEAKVLEALRAIKSAILLLKTSKDSTGEVTEAMEVSTLQRLVKQRKEAAEMFKANNRMELYDDEMFQVSVIEKYLPTQMSEDEIRKVVQETISQVGALGAKDMGKVMGVVSKSLAGKADNKIVSAIVKELLGA